jgi:hypothetical protein
MAATGNSCFWLVDFTFNLLLFLKSSSVSLCWSNQLNQLTNLPRCQQHGSENNIFTEIVIGLWHLMPLSTIFQLYHGGQFYWWRKTGVPRENHRPVTSHWKTLSHMLYRVYLSVNRIRTRNCENVLLCNLSNIETS